MSAAGPKLFPQFRADHVGSLKRPAKLLQKRKEQYKKAAKQALADATEQEVEAQNEAELEGGEEQVTGGYQRGLREATVRVVNADEKAINGDDDQLRRDMETAIQLSLHTPSSKPALNAKNQDAGTRSDDEDEEFLRELERVKRLSLGDNET